jgi:hypothetical protein
MRKTIGRVAPWLARPALLVLLLGLSRAQTVTPVISELGNPAKGHVEYVNGSDMPLTVVLEARSFTVSGTGEVAYRPLDPEIHLKLSTSSFRIQPQQRFYVFYEASSSKSPAWFVIYASFSGFPFRTAQGMNVRVLLPHTVYLLPKQQIEQHEIRIARAEVNPSAGKALIEVENTGDNFGRVLQTQLVYPDRKQEAPGFPVFPHARRIIEISIDPKGQRLPVEISFQFQKFKVTEKLQFAPAAGSAESVPLARGSQ